MSGALPRGGRAGFAQHQDRGELQIKARAPGSPLVFNVARSSARGPTWGYRLAGAYLRLRGWKVNDATLDKLNELKFTGMSAALTEQLSLDDIDDLAFEERLGLLVDREITERNNRRLKTRLRQAKLKQTACMEDIDYRQPRGLDKSMILRLADCHWVKERLNILLTGPTGVGKTWLACALAHKACQSGHTALYCRLPRLLPSLPLARGDGSYAKLMTRLARTEVLILDDWGLSKLNAEQRRDLLEILEDRHGSRSTIVTSQIPIDQWHELIGDPTLADAILDRLVHNAYKLKLKGESMRKKQSQLTAIAKGE